MVYHWLLLPCIRLSQKPTGQNIASTALVHCISSKGREFDFQVEILGKVARDFELVGGFPRYNGFLT